MKIKTHFTTTISKEIIYWEFYILPNIQIHRRNDKYLNSIGVSFDWLIFSASLQIKIK
jgi:hypothetical protein